jgi:DNA-binding CsgD family transcriptional regulator
MTSPVTVSERDLRTLVHIITDSRADLPAEGLPPSLLSDLADQIRCDTVGFFGLDSGQQLNLFGQEWPADSGPADSGDDDLPVFWQHYWDSAPCSYPDRSGDLRRVTTISDFYSARQWHSSGMYSDYFRPWGVDHELLMCLPAASGPSPGPGQTLRLMFTRGPGPDFSERDRSLLALLRPHLHQAYLDTQRRRNDKPELTHRQRELMVLVAAGQTNTQIARQLGLAEGTVRKHLENIYARLHVSSRTAAVIRTFPHHATL